MGLSLYRPLVMVGNADLRTRLDPTRTTMVRRSFEADAKRRLRELTKAIREYLESLGNSAIRVNAFEYRNKAEKAKDFTKWLTRQHERGLLEVIQGPAFGRSPWSSTYVMSAYQKGLAQAAANMRGSGVEVSNRWIDAGFFRPIHADSISLAFTRQFTDLKGITDAVDSRLSGILAQGMSEGLGVQTIARQMAASIEAIGVNRAKVLARTEVIRAHAESTLNTYEEAGLEGVEVLSEFVTAGDGKVCPKCEALEGKRFTIQQARGVIPVHPNCRCAWLPVVGDVSGVKLL